jgi:cohesin loading factor subunit SCC2
MNNRRESKGKGATKDLNKAPVKAQGVNGDKFWEEVSSAMAAFESKESMIKQCRSFVELLSVDRDFKIAVEGDDDGARLTTPSEDEENGTPGPPGGSGRGRKRKASGTPGGRKKRARSSSVPLLRGRYKGSGKKQPNDRESVEINDEEG